MLKKKGLFAPKKKIIKKPKFILELAVCLAICLTVSSVLTSKYLDKRKDDAIDMLDEQYQTFSQSAADALGAYSDAEAAADSGIAAPDADEKKTDLETTMYMYSMITGEYAEAYQEHTKLMETPTGYYSAVRFNQRSDKPKGTFVLEDESYIAPLTAYKDGKYDPVENTKSILKYRGEAEAYSSYARLGWTPKQYDFHWETIYVNEETHRFLPGKVKIMDYFKGELYDEFDLTPEDTKGYTLVKTEDDLQMWMHGYLDPQKAEEPIGEMICEAGRGFSGGDLLEKNWPMWSFRTTRTYFEKSSVYELLPITSRVMWIQDTIAAVLAALVISLIWYLKKKSVWEIFEYRKSTTEAMAHDLKTPLAAISMYAECMEDQPEKAGEYTGRIRENVTEMNQMLEKILSFSKSEGGGNTIAKSAVDMEKLIRETISKYDGLFAKNQIEVKVYKQEDCVIKTDENLMRQTIENLLSNCAKYAEPESEVRVFIKSSRLEFSNKTSLSGVNVEELKKPFVKGDTSRGENGTGLGLAIVDNNLKILGYRLGLELEEGWFTAEILL